MAVTEQARLALREAARATLGEEEGDTLMAITAPANTDLATRQDLERFQESIVSRIELQLTTSLGELRTEMAELRSEMVRGDGALRTEMAELRTEMVRSDGALRTEIGELRTEMVRGDSELLQQVARSANSTLRWVLATFLLAQGGTIGYLNLILR
jgi:hypothetical protein